MIVFSSVFDNEKMQMNNVLFCFSQEHRISGIPVFDRSPAAHDRVKRVSVASLKCIKV